MWKPGRIRGTKSQDWAAVFHNGEWQIALTSAEKKRSSRASELRFSMEINTLKSKLDLHSHFDHPVGWNLKEVGHTGSIAAHQAEQATTPPAH